MANNLIKEIHILSGKIKRVSNISTLVFIIIMGFTISQWHRVMGIDNFINASVMALSLAINVKFYMMYINLSSLNNEAADINIKNIYKSVGQEYKQLLRISLWIVIVIGIGKLLLY